MSNVAEARKSFWTHMMELLLTLFMWNLTSFGLEEVLVWVQDRCTLCAKRTISSEIVLDAADGTPR